MESNRGKLDAMIRRLKDTLIDYFFEIGIAVKGGFALLEIVGSFVVLYITPNTVRRVVAFFTREELTEDPTDLVANYIMHLAGTFSIQAQVFTFIYLLVHGLVKLFLVIMLFKKRLWAYPASMAAFSLFVAYELFRYFEYSHSIWYIVLSVFDMAIIWVIWREYKLVKERKEEMIVTGL